MAKQDFQQQLHKLMAHVWGRFSFVQAMANYRVLTFDKSVMPVKAQKLHTESFTA